MHTNFGDFAPTVVIVAHWTGNSSCSHLVKFGLIENFLSGARFDLHACGTTTLAFIPHLKPVAGYLR
jgi:hypothetical protein